MTSLLEKGFEAQAESLRQFGYPSVKASDVRDAHEKWTRGEDLTDVIAMFCQSAFEEHPEIFGTVAS